MLLNVLGPFEWQRKQPIKLTTRQIDFPKVSAAQKSKKGLCQVFG